MRRDEELETEDVEGGRPSRRESGGGIDSNVIRTRAARNINVDAEYLKKITILVKLCT